MAHQKTDEDLTHGMQMLMHQWDLEELAASAALTVAADLGVDVEVLVALVVEAAPTRPVNT